MKKHRKQFAILLLIIMTLVLTGCGAKSMKSYGKQMIGIVDDYLDLKTDAKAAHEKARVIDDQSSAYFEKLSDNNSFTENDYEIYLTNSIICADFFGIIYNFDNNADLIEDADELRELLK